MIDKLKRYSFPATLLLDEEVEGGREDWEQGDPVNEIHQEPNNLRRKYYLAWVIMLIGYIPVLPIVVVGLFYCAFEWVAKHILTPAMRFYADKTGFGEVHRIYDSIKHDYNKVWKNDD